MSGADWAAYYVSVFHLSGSVLYRKAAYQGAMCIFNQHRQTLANYKLQGSYFKDIHL